MTLVTDIETLEEIYGNAGAASLTKVAQKITPEYRKWIDASNFCILSTVGPDGVDGSPRGDIGKVLHELDENTLLMPDWRGNNRMDSLRNIINDGRLSVMFMVGGSNTVIRINGTGQISVDAKLIDRFNDRGNLPKTVVVIHIQEVYFQCAKALKRSDFWNADIWPDLNTLPTPGQIIKAMSDTEFDASQYDHSWPERAKTTMW